MSNYDPNNTDPSAWPNTVRPGDPIPPDSVVGNSELWRGKPKKRRHIGRNIAIVIGGLFMLLIVAAVLTPGKSARDGVTAPPPVATTVDNGPTPDPVVTPTNIPTVEPSESTEPSEPPATKQMTASQEQAVGAAEQYLELTAFSRKGLIQQLTSDAVGFSVTDATFAVDHIAVNWNDQAAAAAKQYLELTHFSRAGLIQQLESDAVGFTHKQAVYGVTKAGL